METTTLERRPITQIDAVPDSSADKQTRHELRENLAIDPELLRLIPGFDLYLMRAGYWSAQYFNKSKQLAENYPDDEQEVTMQIFQKTPGATVGGIELVKALIHISAGEYSDPVLAEELTGDYLEQKELEQAYRTNEYLNDYTDHNKQLMTSSALLKTKRELDKLWQPAGEKIKIETLVDEGNQSEAFAPIIKLRGPYKYFAHLESVYLGLLARATKVATNTKEVVDAAQGKPVLFFADRFDNFANQPIDGYAATLGGVDAVATDAQGAYIKQPGKGTTPHALIALHHGSTKQAMLQYVKKYGEEECIVLSDFENNSATTAVESLTFLQEHGYSPRGIRLDTSGSMVDETILYEPGLLEANVGRGMASEIRMQYEENKATNNIQDNSLFTPEHLQLLKEKQLTGVNKLLCNLVRKKLNQAGFTETKIFVSGGFTAEKISTFEQANVPVDGYGVGSSLLTNKYVQSNGDFTADIVTINGKPCSKVGRKELSTNQAGV